MIEIILKKKRGEEHSPAEINYVVEGFTSGTIPDYQMSAWLMAVCFQGLHDRETAALTNAMVQSGETIDLSHIPGLKVDKHSTGGVGDKTTLVLAPLVAAAGLPVAKMSGRGLGHTGGTLDKLEAIPGFKVDIASRDFVQQIKKIGLAVCAQSHTLVPADKKMYALRDVTGTVDNVSLIASSIMSKKLASGADAIVIDIKMGEGAFMKTLEQAEELAHIMKATAKNMGKKLVAVITNMNQPLGYAVGNLLEVEESIATLKGQGPSDLQEVCLALGSHMLVLGGKYSNYSQAHDALSNLLHSGKAFDKFCEFVEAQHGDVSFVQQTQFPKAAIIREYTASSSGFLAEVDALAIGNASMLLGAGRKTKESTIDPMSGLVLNKKQGDRVEKGDLMASMYTDDENKIPLALKELNKAFLFQDKEPEHQPLIVKTVL